MIFLLLQQLPFPFDGFALAFPVETAHGTIRGNDAVAGNIRCKGISPQGLAYGLCTSAADTAGQFAITDGLPTGHVEQLQVNFPLELAYLR